MRVLLVEDDAGFREALAAGLAAHGLVVAAACASGEEALARLEEIDAEVALLDLQLPGMSGAATLGRLRELRPGLPALVLTMFEDKQALLEAIAAGAQGYLLKGAPLAEVARALQDVVEGRAPFSPQVAAHLLARVRETSAPRPSARSLSAREREVLALLVHGHSYGDVADALGIRLSTVQGYVKQLYKKLEVSTKAEATYVALREGWLER